MSAVPRASTPRCQRESGTKMGMAISCGIYDELGQTEDRDLLDALDTAMGKRAEPLMIVISDAGRAR